MAIDDLDDVQIGPVEEPVTRNHLQISSHYVMALGSDTPVLVNTHHPLRIPAFLEAIQLSEGNKQVLSEFPGEKLDFELFQETFRKIFEQAGYGLDKDLHIDVYNPSRFENILAGRIEIDIDEFSSRIVFFELKDNKPVRLLTTDDGKTPIVLRGQDPYLTKLGDHYLVELVNARVDNASGVVLWDMEFWVGKSLDHLEHTQTGPVGMKDIRAVGLPNGQLGFYTRPQGDQKGGRGKIGYAQIPSQTHEEGIAILRYMTRNDFEKLLWHAPLLPYQFHDLEWGGVNRPTVLRVEDLVGDDAEQLEKFGLVPDDLEDWLFVSDHRALQKDNGNRMYNLGGFLHKAPTMDIPGEIVDLGILLTRTDFPPGEAKLTGIDRERMARGEEWDETDLSNVLFGEVHLEYAVTGISDKEVGFKKVQNLKKLVFEGLRKRKYGSS